MNGVWPLLIAHELRGLFRTRRVLVLVALYLSAGLLGGFGYVRTAQLAQDTAVETAVARGLSEAEAQAAVAQAASPLSQQIVEAVAGSEDDEIATSLSQSLILPVFFWASLAFLPLLILLTGFDSISSELATRSLRYSVLRAGRGEILFGKAAAQLLIFAVMSAVCAAGLFAMAVGLIEGFDAGSNLLGFARVWLLLLPFAACYVGLVLMASSATQRGFFALLLAFVIAFGLRITGGIAGLVDAQGPWAPMRWLRFVSPAHYHDGLWLADWTGPALSSLAYLAFATLFGALALTILLRRDL